MIRGRIDELVDAAVKTLESFGFSVETISYPEDHRKRGIDIAASRQGESVLVKVVEDVTDLSPRDIRELRDSSVVLGVSSIIVAGANDSSEIDSLVAIDKSGVYVVGVEGLSAALRNEIYVVHRQGKLYMRVNGEKLREERLKKGYSLGDLALMLGVTRRSVYLYEQGKVEVSLPTALRLLEVFGEEVFEPIPVLKEQRREGRHVHSLRKQYSKVRENDVASRAIEGIVSVCGEAIETKRIPPDVVARVRHNRLLILVERKRDKKFEIRIREAVKVAQHVDARVLTVVSSPENRNIAESMGSVDVYRSVSEMVEEIRERYMGA